MTKGLASLEPETGPDDMISQIRRITKPAIRVEEEHCGSYESRLCSQTARTHHGSSAY